MFIRPLKELMECFDECNIEARYDKANEVITLEFAHKPEYSEHAIKYISCVITDDGYDSLLSVVLTQHLDEELYPHAKKDAKKDACETRMTLTADGYGPLEDLAMKIKQCILASEMQLNAIQMLRG